MLIGTDPNDDREEIKQELLKRVNAECHKVKSDKIEVQLKGFKFPSVFKDGRITIGMTVMVHKIGYDQTVDAILGLKN